MRKSLCYGFGLCLALSLWMMSSRASAQAQQPGTLVIEEGTLIDGNGGAPVRDALIVIQGNQITIVARKGQVTVPANTQVIRADGTESTGRAARERGRGRAS